jgi:hypothetical protein
MKEHTPTTGTITFPAPRAGASRTHPTRRERKAQGLVRLGGSLPDALKPPMARVDLGSPKSMGWCVTAHPTRLTPLLFSGRPIPGSVV